MSPRDIDSKARVWTVTLGKNGKLEAVLDAGRLASARQKGVRD